MTRTAAILIDVGYVWTQIARSVGKKGRSDIDLVGYGVPLVQALVEEAEGDDLDVLRCYWYDAAKDAVPTIQQRAIARTPRVKLRLGLLSYGRQKGVDRLLQQDIAALAHHHAVDDLIVLTGDQDMEEELDEAGQHGLLVHLWGVAGKQDADSIAARLLDTVDDWKVLPQTWSQSFVASDDPEDGSTGLIGPSDNQSNTATASAGAVEQATGVDSQPAAKTPESQPDEAPAWMPTPPAASQAKADTKQQEPPPSPQTASAYIAAGRNAYDSLATQHGANWPSIRSEIASSTYFDFPSGNTFRSIPGKYDTELMDTSEAIIGAPITGAARISVRDGFWARLEEDQESHEKPAGPATSPATSSGTHKP